MIPILFDKSETSFTNNGLGRLRDCISCVVTEERNGIYECDFEYPINGAHFDEIQIGRIIGVTHDDTGVIQPFDIVGYERPIDGVVTFHCTHISYRQKFYTVDPTIIEPTVSPEGSMLLLYGSQAQPYNPFWYESDLPVVMKYCPVFDGPPLSVRQFLGGTEGSILDTFGGEYEWNKFTVKLWQNRGQLKDITIRYGVNMLGYNEELNVEEAYSACIPYWTDGTQRVIGDRQVGDLNTIMNRGETIPMDVSDSFENKPTKAQVNAEGLAQLKKLKPALPVQTITVEFVTLKELGEFQNLATCRLCDSVKVVFPDYNTSGTFEIVKVVWNALEDRYEEMELGALSKSLAEALGIKQGVTKKGGASVPVSQDSTTGVLSIG